MLPEAFPFRITTAHDEEERAKRSWNLPAGFCLCLLLLLCLCCWPSVLQSAVISFSREGILLHPMVGLLLFIIIYLSPRCKSQLVFFFLSAFRGCCGAACFLFFLLISDAAESSRFFSAAKEYGDLLGIPARGQPRATLYLCFYLISLCLYFFCGFCGLVLALAARVFGEASIGALFRERTAWRQTAEREIAVGPHKRSEEQLFFIDFRKRRTCMRSFFCVFFLVRWWSFCLFCGVGFVGCEAQDVETSRRELYIHLDCSEVVLLLSESDEYSEDR